jgi:protein-tyrosine phosphatase
VIDLHAHVLPGVDDGPATLADSLALARAAVAAGTRVMVATPHVNDRYDAALAAVPGAVVALQAELDRAGVPLALRGGAEIAISRLPGLDAGTLERLALGGGEWLLLEAPERGPADVPAAVAVAQERGHRVVIAHAERCEALRRDPTALRRLVAGGTLASITAGSLAGRFGAHPRRFAELLLRERLVHNIVSDTHGVEGRPPDVSAARRALPAPLWEWMTEAIPAAVLDGGAVPPAPRARSGWRARLSGH